MWIPTLFTARGLEQRPAEPDLHHCPGLPGSEIPGGPDGGPTTVFQFYQEGEYDQWQEFRLASADDASLRWIAGMYYFFEDAQYSTAVRRTPAPYAPSGPDRFNIVPNTQVQQDNEAISVFGQVDFDLTDDLTLTTGLRWTNETKKGSNAPSVRCVGTVGASFCPSFPEDAFVGADDVAGFPASRPGPEQLDGDWDEWGATGPGLAHDIPACCSVASQGF